MRNPTKPDPVDSRAPRIPVQRTPYEELILSGWDHAGAALAAIDALFADAIHDSVAHFTSWPCTLYDLRGIYCDSKQPWVELGGSMQRFPKMPPGPPR